MQKVFSFDALRPRVLMTSLRTAEVAVAVRHMMGTVGKVFRK